MIYIPVIIIISILFLKYKIKIKKETFKLNEKIKKHGINPEFSPKKSELKNIFLSEFPHEYIEILKKNFYLYNFLPQTLKAQLHAHINVFLSLKSFHGHKNLKISDTIRLTIASQACMLLLNKKYPCYFPKLQTIEVYPTAFVSDIHTGNGLFKKQARTGESWNNGRLILSWNHSRQRISQSKDGSNVVMHEFAHRLDQLDNRADGIPDKHFESEKEYYIWREIIFKQYKKHLKSLKRKNKKLLTKYAGTNLAEFFAVSTEFFFEKPRQLKKHEPDLYNLLKNFYNLDPVNWKVK